MKSWKEIVAPRYVLAGGFIFFLLLAGVLLFSPPDLEVESHSLPTWIAEPKREKVDLSADLQNVDGQPVDLAKLQKKALFLNFWATWCGPCRAEMPSMASLHNDLSSSGLTIVAVTDEDPQLVRDYLERNPYPFPVVIDSKGTLLERFRVRVLPTSLILDGRSRIAYSHQGAIQWDTPEIRAQFENLLAQ